MEHLQRSPQFTRSRNGNLDSYIFPNGNDEVSVDPIVLSVHQADAALCKPHPKPSHSQQKAAPVIFKVESATSSLSSPSEAGIIRPPCSTRSQKNKNKPSSSKIKASAVNVAENRNDENPVMTLQKLMSKKTPKPNESSRMETETPTQPQTQFRGSFADLDVKSRRRRAGIPPPPQENRTSMVHIRRTDKDKKMPPVYRTVIADIPRYPQPQDTLDDVFNVLEHALCPDPNISMKKDALDTVFGAAEKMLCGPDPKYAYMHPKIKPDDDQLDEYENKEKNNRLLQKAIDEKLVLTRYPRLIAEGAKSKNYDLVVAAAEAASKLTLEAPPTIPPPSAKLLLLQEQSQKMVSSQDLLDVICNQVEAATCNPQNRITVLLDGRQHKQLVQQQHKDVLDLFCEGVEHQVCGASLASEEMITFGSDPEEQKRQALQRLFKPPTRKKGFEVSAIFTPPAMNRKRATLPQVNNTILPPALMRRQAAFRVESREETEDWKYENDDSTRRADERSSHRHHPRSHGTTRHKTTVNKEEKGVGTKSNRDPLPSMNGSNQEGTLARLPPHHGEHKRESAIPNVDSRDGTDLHNVFYWVPTSKAQV